MDAAFIPIPFSSEYIKQNMSSAWLQPQTYLEAVINQQLVSGHLIS